MVIIIWTFCFIEKVSQTKVKYRPELKSYSKNESLLCILDTGKTIKIQNILSKLYHVQI